MQTVFIHVVYAYNIYKYKDVIDIAASTELCSEWPVICYSNK